MADCSVANVERLAAAHYEPYAPYQFLAYWWELWGEYEKLFGPLSRMPREGYRRITGHNMRNGAAAAASTPPPREKRKRRAAAPKGSSPVAPRGITGPGLLPGFRLGPGARAEGEVCATVVRTERVAVVRRSPRRPLFGAVPKVV